MIRLLLLFIMLSSYACFAPEEKLTVGDLSLVDSFYRRDLHQLQLDLTDSCAVYRDRVMPSLIDSIRSVRYAEIQQLIESYEQK